MALFKSSPEKILSNAIAARDKLIARLSDSEIAIIGCQTHAERCAIDGASDDVLSGAEDKLRAAQERRVTLRAALSSSEALVARLEHERDEQADKEQREKTGAEVELLAREVVEAGAAFVAAATVLADCALRASVVVPESGGLVRFAGACRSEIPAGGDLVAKLLRNHGAAVLARSAPALLAQPPQAYAAPTATPAPTVQLFALRPVRWIAADGAQRLGQKFSDVFVTHSAASRGLAVGALAVMDSPLRREHHNTVGGSADPALAFDLDAEPVREAAPVLASAFTPVDRGAPFTLKVAR
jgi:hypothetical protein